MSSDNNFQKLSLHYLEFLLFRCTSRETYLRQMNIYDTVINMAVSIQIQSLHQGVLFLLENCEDKGMYYISFLGILHNNILL